jgi:NAD+ synthase
METTRHLAADLTINTGLVRSLLVGFLRDETQKAGFARGVLGLSGGVDSAVTAYLAAEALGPENVLGVLLPYRTSDPRSRSDAELVAKELGIRSEVVDITPMVDAYLKNSGDEGRVRAGNVMARQRMIVLYDLSWRDRARVYGTSNKTELMLGYGTLFGDMACALNPLGDLYKSQVWQLAESLGVPRHIIQKPPTADLWAGQTDEAELGIPYAVADHLLFKMVDDRRTDAELRADGFDVSLIARVRSAIAANQFKRRPPVIAKVSHRTVNVDFRYPRDWGI